MITLKQQWLALCLFFACAGACAAEAADNDAAPDWGPAIHSVAPAIDAPDQHGARQTLETLAGRNGLLLFFVRSADW